MRVLVTGGAGFIGSHITLRLAECGHDPVIYDSFATSKRETPATVARMAARPIPVVVGDTTDAARLSEAMATAQPDAVIHCAGLKSIAESISHPERYRRANVEGVRTLLTVMGTAGVHRLVFSSSASVYDYPGPRISEDASVGTHPAHPYAASKVAAEQIARAWQQADPRRQVDVLRYFNPVGAHPRGLLGEDPLEEPSNLFPLVTRALAGVTPFVHIAGTDYNTPDGTCIRDFVHVSDLAEAHVAALERPPKAFRTLNLGTGKGHSVREVLDEFSRVIGRTVPARHAPRRPGDAPVVTADASRAETALSWTPRRSLADACRDAWTWQCSQSGRHLRAEP